MNRNGVWAQALVWAVVIVMAAPIGGFAQENGGAQPPDSNGKYSKAQLDQMLAPVALYPDSLLAQVLIGATYPDQVADADHWVKDHSDLKGDALNDAVDKMNWDLSIKALVPFPQVLGMMDEHMDWTTKLGQAFLAQQQEVMAQIQLLRQKAYAAGNLKTTEQQKVVAKGDTVEIEPAQQDVVYVPYYDPSVVYGNWWWPGYPPYAWYPLGAPFFTVGLFGFGWGIGVGPFWGWGWGSWGWGGGWAGGGNVFINVNRTVNINDPHANLNRSTMRTANLTNAARSGARDPVSTAAARAGGRTVSGTGTGRTAAGTRAGTGGTGSLTGRGAAGRGSTAAGGRPSAASVTSQLERGNARARAAARGGARTGNAAGGGGRATGNVSRGGSRTTGNVSRGGAMGRERDIAPRGTTGGRSNFSRASAGGGFHGGGFHGGGGGGFHGGGGGGHGGGGRR